MLLNSIILNPIDFSMKGPTSFITKHSPDCPDPTGNPDNVSLGPLEM